MGKVLSVRKHPRLKGYNYSNSGAYFITFCVKDRHQILGKIVGRGFPDAPHINIPAPDAPHPSTPYPNGSCMIELSEYGLNLCNTIEDVNSKIDNITIDKYVVMPNHAHMIVLIDKTNCAEQGNSGASGKPRPTNAIIPKIMSSIKRYTNRLAGFDMWQGSYHDHIIRNERDYLRIWQYIDENPAKWKEDRYYEQCNENY